MNIAYRARSATVVVFLVCTACASAFCQAAAPAPLTNKDIVELVKVGLGQEVLEAKIKSSLCAFDTSPQALMALKSAGVPDSVILDMVRAAPVRAQISGATQSDAEAASDTAVTTELQPDEEIRKPSRVPRFQQSTSPNGESGRQSSIEIRSVAYRVIPQQTTTYFRSGQSSSYTNCYGQGFDTGMFLNLSMNCDTSYTNPVDIPVTWRFADVYNVVETDGQRLLVGCRANWRWSKCSPLVPGNVFSAELKGTELKVTAYKNGDLSKRMEVKYHVLQQATVP